MKVKSEETNFVSYVSLSSSEEGLELKIFDEDLETSGFSEKQFFKNCLDSFCNNFHISSSSGADGSLPAVRVHISYRY